MEITLIPSSVSAQNYALHQYLISYLINGTVAVDAGSLGLYLGPDEQARVRHLLLTHSHIDHIATLPIFLENAYEAKLDCVTIHASEAVLDCLKQDVFNGRIWPDFIGLSETQAPFLKLNRIESGRPFVVEGLRVTPVEVDHLVPTLGFVLEDEHSAAVIVSDTGPTRSIWEVANRTPNLRAVFLEASFPNDMADLARISHHLTPETFAVEVRKLDRPARILAVHIKPRYRDRILAELDALGLPGLEIARFGEPYDF